MYTVGGRGGKVYTVTRLADDNQPGSLRYGVQQSGARTIVFDVSGVIELNSTLEIKNSHLTMAGQTAPGDGITLAHYPVVVKADQVIIRFMRFRMGDVKAVEGDAIWGRYQKNILIDHCSMSWSTDECASFYGNIDFTLQWCLIAESLTESVHGKGAHGYGGIWGGNHASFHHNLLMHHDSRLPRFDHPGVYSSSYPADVWRGPVDYRNNVVYNWGANHTYGGEGGTFNMVNNYYRPGPASTTRNRFLEAYKESYTYGKFYLEGNVHSASSAISANNASGITLKSGGNVADLLLSEPLQVKGDRTTHTAELAFERVIAHAGASLVRDALDLRYAEEAQQGVATKIGSVTSKPRYGLIDTQNDAGGWPVLQSKPALPDADGDGMPDSWEVAQGLNPLVIDGHLNQLHPQYTNLEVYLHSLVSAVVTAQNQGGISTGISTPSGAAIMLRVFPNPAAEELVVEANETLAGIEIYAVTGTRVYRGAPNTTRATVPVAHLPRGVYVLAATDRTGNVTNLKWMKK